MSEINNLNRDTVAANDPWAIMLNKMDEPGDSGHQDPILGDEEIDRLMGLSVDRAEGSGKAAVAEAATLASGLSPTMRLIADTFVETLGRSIRQGVSGLIDVSLLDLSLIRLSNGMARLPLPSLIATMSSRSLGGAGLIVADQCVAAAFFDLMLGGAEANDSLQRALRPYSSIELKLFRKFAEFVARGFEDATSEVMKADFSIDKIETNPYLLSLEKSTENAVRLQMQILFGRRGGKIDLLLPLSMFGPYESLIRADEIERYTIDDASWRRHLVRSTASSSIGIEAVLANFKLPVRSVLGFSVGDVIPLNINPQTPIWLKSGDRSLCLGLMGRSRGQIALRVVGPLTSKEEK